MQCLDHCGGTVEECPPRVWIAGHMLVLVVYSINCKSLLIFRELHIIDINNLMRNAKKSLLQYNVAIHRTNSIQTRLCLL